MRRPGRLLVLCPLPLLLLRRAATPAVATHADHERHGHHDADAGSVACKLRAPRFVVRWRMLQLPGSRKDAPMDISSKIAALEATDLVLISCIGALMSSIGSNELLEQCAKNMENMAAHLLQSEDEKKLQLFLDLKDQLLAQWGMKG
jgi:hypothetical protein